MARAPETGLRLNPEMVVGASAVVIGVCALLVSLYEARLMRQEQRSSVLPIVELGRSHYVTDDETGTDRWRLSTHASNVGIGPARIQDFRVTVDGKPYRTWGSAMEALIGVGDIRYGQSTINGRTIPADRDVTMFDLSDRQHSAAIVREFHRLDFEACFCSVFDECWTSRYSAFGAVEAVDGCRQNGESFLE